jgi:hypothetical protein
MGISCIATDASATCKFKAKKDIIVILDVGHTDKDSGQISARGVKEYDFNMNLARRVLEELVNTGFLSTQMIVMAGSNTHESRLQRGRRIKPTAFAVHNRPANYGMLRQCVALNLQSKRDGRVEMEGGRTSGNEMLSTSRSQRRS